MRIPVIAQIGADHRDSAEVALQKMILVGVVLASAVAAALWGLVYIAVGARTAGAIPAAYSLLSLANTVLFSMFPRYQVYRFAQLSLILLLPSEAIQITQATYELIQHDFVCETRGTIDVKGSGEMEIWHILSERPSGHKYLPEMAA